MPRRWRESHQQGGLGFVVHGGPVPDCRRCSTRKRLLQGHIRALGACSMLNSSHMCSAVVLASMRKGGWRGQREANTCIPSHRKEVVWTMQQSSPW
jgi:hypothetical protein